MVLSRLANHLFWFGRYLERTEHTARFSSTQYFSTIDSPAEQHKKFVYNSIVYMYGIGNGPAGAHELEKLLGAILFDPNNQNSIRQTAGAARSNLMNLRNVISVEIWETMNRFHLSLTAMPVKPRQRIDFDQIQRILEYCALIRNLVNSTLLHDETWAIIRFGIYLERAIQINRIVASQMTGIENLAKGEDASKVRNHLLVTLLKSLQAKDMYYKMHRDGLHTAGVAEFLVTEKLFPRAIHYNLHKSRHIYNSLFAGQPEDPAGYEINKMADTFKYLRKADIAGDIPGFLQQTLHKTEEIAYLLERNHLRY